MIFTDVCHACAVHDEHMDDVSLHTYIHTHIHRYGEFLVNTINVGLASAHPNYIANNYYKLRILNCSDINCSACYKDPYYPDDYIFEAKLLPNVTMPPRTLRPQGVLGPYQPQIGFSQREGPHRSYSTPSPARRMIRLVSL